MADYYVKSSAVGTGDGSSWTNAYTTLKTAMEARLAGDRFWVSNNHAETQAVAMTITSPGTPASPQLAYCVADTSTPPTALATTGTVTTTGTSGITLLGFAYVYGLSITNGSGSAANSSITIGNTSASTVWKFEHCALQVGTTSASGRFAIGALAGTVKDQLVELVNTTLQFNNASQFINLIDGRFVWRNTATAIAGATLPTTLFNNSGSGTVQAVISGVDLSALGSGKNLVNISGNNTLLYNFRNCKTGASVAFTTGAIAGQGGTEAYFDNCDSAATNYRMEHYKYQGSIVQETVIVRSGGATDGTTPLSWHMTSLSVSSFTFPLSSPPFMIWNDTVSASKTATVEFIHDSLTALQNNEIWLQIEYMGDSGDPLSTPVNNSVASIFASPANQPSSSVTWTTTGITNPNKQKLAVTFTPLLKGWFRARVMLAKLSYTVYVDPLITVS